MQSKKEAEADMSQRFYYPPLDLKMMMPDEA